MTKKQAKEYVRILVGNVVNNLEICESLPLNTDNKTLTIITNVEIELKNKLKISDKEKFSESSQILNYVLKNY